MVELLTGICRHLESGEDLVLATVTGQTGSTPRAVGTRMAIRADGTVMGTIGGGLVEFQTQKRAREVFETGRATAETVEFTGADAAATDRMICGGSMEILLELIKADPGIIEEMKGLIAALKRGDRGFLITSLDPICEEARRMEWCLVQNDTVTLGRFTGPDAWIGELTGRVGGSRQSSAITLEGRRFLVEPVVVPGTVFLFGAGHVSRPVAELAGLVEFRTVVLDDRPEYAHVERFPKADRIIVIPSFQQAFEGLVIDGNSYLVILTRGHLHDRTVLEQALKTDAGYIGMIGSRRKRELIYQELQTRGFGQSDLERVHAPIGLAIGAETPEEIAISIVAELIRARSARG